MICKGNINFYFSNYLYYATDSKLLHDTHINRVSIAETTLKIVNKMIHKRSNVYKILPLCK
jgi:hypothetical protein